MRKIVGVLTVVALMAFGGIAFAIDSTVTTSVTATVSQTFAIELTKGGTMTFGPVTGSESYVEPVGHVGGQSDAEVICRTNSGLQWALKLYASSLSAGMTPDNLLIFTPASAFNRNIAAPNAIAGGMGQTEGWHNIWTTATTIFTDWNTAGGYNTAPNGYLLSFNYALCPLGTFVSGATTLGGGHQLGSGSHSATITYTMTTSL